MREKRGLGFVTLISENGLMCTAQLEPETDFLAQLDFGLCLLGNPGRNWAGSEDANQ